MRPGNSTPGKNDDYRSVELSSNIDILSILKFCSTVHRRSSKLLTSSRILENPLSGPINFDIRIFVSMHIYPSAESEAIFHQQFSCVPEMITVYLLFLFMILRNISVTDTTKSFELFYNKSYTSTDVHCEQIKK